MPKPHLVEVLPLLAAGCSDRQIGERVCLTTEGAKLRVRALRSVYGAASRAHLVRLAVEAGHLRLTPARGGAR